MLKRICFFILTILIFFTGTNFLYAQAVVSRKDSLAKDSVPGKDVTDLFNEVFRKNKKNVPDKKKNGSLSLLPSISYTPSTGLTFGGEISATRYFGDPATTKLSVFDIFGAMSTNELAFIQLKHNIYTADNKWNISGTYDVGKTIVLDHGIGTGREMPVIFPIRYTYLNFNENVYRRLFPNFYAGAGVSFNYYTKIDEDLPGPGNRLTHNFLYSKFNGFPPNRYFANGLQIDLQYNTRDQPYRPYRGLYIDVILRANQTWLGSDQNATQLKTELRKYWSLSSKNPEHVLAFWLWGSYKVKGVLPYLDLPGTGSDTDQRIGRGYTVSRFKGPSFFYNELEYRFPITNNKLISGVAFFNVETASNQRNDKLFNYWDPGAGAGIRILFDKHTRSNLCIDYGVGNYGSNGVYIGLNEAF